MRKLIAAVLCVLTLFTASCADAGDPSAEATNEENDMTKTIFYSDFGAKGDGVTNDYKAIKDAHESANKSGAMVCADPGAVYYIGWIPYTIPIRTDVDWGDTEFIIDDTKVSYKNKERGVWIFTIEPSTKAPALNVPDGLSIGAGQTDTGIRADRPCMIRIEDSLKTDYLRYGVNADNGSTRTEMLLIDADGKVDGSTPVQYDYGSVTATAYTIDDKPITIRGGKFTTRANDPLAENPDYPGGYDYYARGILCTRSNVTLEGIEHYIEGERWDTPVGGGAPYAAFYQITNAYNVTLKDCVATGHREFAFVTSGGQLCGMGSYDLQSTRSVDVKLIGLTQSNSITDREHQHGLIGTNYTRNILMENCHVDRFDSHKGLYNATIRNSTLGFDLFVIGGGELVVENVKRLSGWCFIGLREDYGSVWNGSITIKDCEYAGGKVIIGGTWRSFNTGLPANIGTKILIDRLKVTDPSTCVYHIKGASAFSLTDTVNPLIPPSGVTFRNMNPLPLANDPDVKAALDSCVVVTE